MTLRRAVPFWAKKKAGGGLAYTPPLDVYGTDIFAGLSPVRKLRTAYTGPAVRMIDDNTLIEYDIPFKTDGEVDQDFVVSTSISIGRRLRVIKIYDQSGNGNDFTCTVSGYYTDATPGVFNKYTFNGKPILSRVNYTNPSTAFGNNTPKSYFSVGGVPSSTFPNTVLQHFETRAGSTGWLFRANSSTIGFFIIGGATVTFSVTNPNDTQYITGFTHDSSQLASIYKNGVLLNSGTASGGTDGSILRNDGSGNENDWIQDRLIYLGDKTADAINIQTNLNDYYGTY